MAEPQRSSRSLNASRLQALFHSLGDEKAHLDLHSVPTLRRGEAIEIVDTFSIDDVDRLLTIQGMGHPNLYLHNSTRALKRYHFYPYSDAFTRLYSPSRVIRDYIMNGTTVLVHNLHRHHPVIASLHNDLRRACATLDKSACFLSPPHSQATTPHADDHPNVIVQLFGTKLWTIWDLVLEEEIAAAKSVKQLVEMFISRGRQKTPVVNDVLEPGDVLIVPQRFMHTARTLDNHSLSIAFQIRCCTVDLNCERFLEGAALVPTCDQDFVSVI
jgi:hypothetical protein